MYGISAALPSWRAAPNAASIRARPVEVRVRSAIEALQALEGFGQVLVAAPAEADDVVPGATRIVERPGDRVGGLQRRHDALQSRQLAEGEQRLGVGHRLVARPAGVAELGVLGAD